MTLRREQFRIMCRERVIPLDGAMGTLLYERGLAAGVPPDALNLERSDAVMAAHAEYVEAGAGIILTNTFGATRARLAPYGLAGRADDINRAAVAIARQAAGDRALVAGDVGPLGLYLEPIGPLSFERAYRDFRGQARVLADAGVDLIIIETVADLREAKAAVMACRDVFAGPVVATMTFDADGRTATGTPAAVAAITLAAAGADAVGANCTLGPRELVPIIREMANVVSAPLCVQPNAGKPRLVGDRTVFRQQPGDFATYVPKLVSAGASLVGGCCGTTPDHVRALVAASSGLRPASRPRPRPSFLASRTRLVAVAGPPVIVGERINPTGKPKLQKELAAGKFGLVSAWAKEQTAAGAAVIDVNVGAPPDAAAAMRGAVRAVQNAADAAVSVDAAAAAVLEAGLSEAVGKPLLNSCRAARADMNRLLPLARKWGAAVVGLAMGAKGVPTTSAQRLTLVEEFITRALDEGIAPDDIYIDALMLSAVHRSPAETFTALQEIKFNFGVRTILGISNVSHGLPRRETLNVAVYLYAVGQRLDVAIVNPLEANMRDAVAASALITGSTDAAAYLNGITPGRSGPGGPAKKTGSDELYDAIVEGRKEDAPPAASRALKQKRDPLAISEKSITRALTEVGRRYEKREYYLPHVIRAAEAAQAAFKALAPALRKSRVAASGRVVLATVAGDVHDIGKNVLAAVLRSHGLDVIDLGKNVPTSRVVAAARRHDADVVALSALMTTTMPQMPKVIEGLRRARLRAQPLVGGATVTLDFAKKIGAAYAPDAVSAVPVTKRLVAAARKVK